MSDDIEENNEFVAEEKLVESNIDSTIDSKFMEGVQSVDDVITIEESLDPLFIPTLGVPTEEKNLYKITSKDGEMEVIEAQAAFIAIKMTKIEKIVKVEHLRQEFVIINKNQMKEFVDKYGDNEGAPDQAN